VELLRPEDVEESNVISIVVDIIDILSVLLFLCVGVRDDDTLSLSFFSSLGVLLLLMMMMILYRM
jgi:hypothetical protein